MSDFPRITRNPDVMQGKACIRDMGMIVGQIGAGVTIEEMLKNYPYLERQDILEALRYAAALASEREVSLAKAS